MSAEKIERPANEPARIKNARLARKAKDKGVVVKVIKKATGK